jgi:hypothetical protein
LNRAKGKKPKISTSTTERKTIRRGLRSKDTETDKFRRKDMESSSKKRKPEDGPYGDLGSLL